jgi:hypothetical protein
VDAGSLERDRGERRSAFDAEVEASAAEFDLTRRGLPLEELKDWFARTAAGERVPMPPARALPKR